VAMPLPTMTSNLGKCGAGYLDNKLPQDAHYSVNSGINYLQMHNLIRRDVFQFLPVFIVQNALEIAHLPLFLQISQA
jgi:hypothetical protein